MVETNREMPEEIRVLGDTLLAVATKLPSMLASRRKPFDVISFAYSNLNDDKFFHAICRHPDRGGPIFGCLLARDDPERGIVAVPGTECSYRVPVGSNEAKELKRRMEKEAREVEFDF